ncbi:MAG: hypothetical protein V7607_1198 [Solirubrobacteraceae bacterium]
MTSTRRQPRRAQPETPDWMQGLLLLATVALILIQAAGGG